MTTTYQQTDTDATFDVGCSGQSAGATTGADEAAVGGSAGVTETAFDPDNNVTRACYAYDCTPAPGLATWESGNYVVRINHTAMDGGTQLQRVDVCDFDGTSSYAFVANNSSTGHTRGATGVLEVTVNRATPYAVQDETNSRLFVVLTYNNNDLHGASAGGITPDDTIVAPYTVPAGLAASKIAALTARRAQPYVPTWQSIPY